MKWLVDEMTVWWNYQLMKRLVVEITSLQSDYWVKINWNECCMKLALGETIIGLNDQLIKLGGNDQMR